MKIMKNRMLKVHFQHSKSFPLLNSLENLWGICSLLLTILRPSDGLIIDPAQTCKNRFLSGNSVPFFCPFARFALFIRIYS